MESSHILSPVAPARPLAGYLGGKRMLARELGARISAIPHKTYAEVFVGMGGVFLRRTVRSKAEVINDLGRDVSNLFRIAQRHPDALAGALRLQLSSRDDFERLERTDPDTLTDVERAARFVVLQRLAFGSRVAGRHFGVSAASHLQGGFRARPVIDAINALHRRLEGVIVERLPWEAFVRRYDTPETLYYLDPPYFGNEDDYGRGLFDRSQFERMAQVLGAIRGHFILSLNDRPEVRATFARFSIDSVGTHYGISGKGETPAREVIITG